VVNAALLMNSYQAYWRIQGRFSLAGHALFIAS